MTRIATICGYVILCACVCWSQTNVPGGAIPNSKHYRDSGVGNATGRSGAATMTARALLGKDGNTTIELTTGTLDSLTTPPGSFDRVQFKPFSGTGNLLYTQNFTPASSTGYFSFTSPSLYRSEQVQLQGNISGVDQSRTDVVTVVETVKLRPDLAVTHVQLPPTGIVNQMVNISATVTELNGDAGANATCQLLVDDSLADATPQPIWVDAGDSVSCAFSYRFATAGTHNIEVVAANVTPADWDTSNNSATGSINITESFPRAFATFSDSKGQFPLVGDSTETILQNGAVVDTSDETFQNTAETQYAFANFFRGGCGASIPQFSFPVNLAYTETMNGAPVYTFSSSISPGVELVLIGSFPICGTYATYQTESFESPSNGTGTYLTSWQYFNDRSNSPIASYQEVEVARFAGTTTYFSAGFVCYWWNNPKTACNNPPLGVYMWNTSGNGSSGPFVPLGNFWQPNVQITDAAGNSYSGSIAVSLTANQFNVTNSETCHNYGPDAGGFIYQFCSSVNENYTLTFGSATQ